jgi:hypothetical protein
MLNLIQATDRKLAPLKRNPSPREQLLDSIRKGRVLKPVAQGLKNRREYFYAQFDFFFVCLFLCVVM